MNDKEIINIIEQTLETKMKENDKFIRYSFFELKVKYNLNEEELQRFFKFIKAKLEKQNYTILFTGAKYTFENTEKIVESNELMIAIKE